MKRYLLAILVLFSAAVNAPLVAQDGGISRKQQENIQAKKEKEDKKAQKKAEKEGLRRHMNLQDKPTRKRLKKNLRRTKKTGSAGNGQPFYHRWFTKRR